MLYITSLFNGFIIKLPNIILDQNNKFINMSGETAKRHRSWLAKQTGAEPPKI